MKELTTNKMIVFVVCFVFFVLLRVCFSCLLFFFFALFFVSWFFVMLLFVICFVP